MPAKPADVGMQDLTVAFCGAQGGALPAALLLAFPVLESGYWPGKHDRLARGARGEHLPGIEVLDDVGPDHRRQHQHTSRRVDYVVRRFHRMAEDFGFEGRYCIE